MNAPRRRALISLLLAGFLLLPGCALLAPAVSSVNSSVISDAWLDETVAVVENDPILLQVIGAKAGPEVRRSVLEREVLTQIFESEVYAKGVDPQPFVDALKPQVERELTSRYQAKSLSGPSKEAVDLFARWFGMPQAFITAATGLPERPTREALEQVYEQLPLLGLKLCFSVIGVSTPEKAKQVQDRIAAKESFSVIAADLSDDQATKPSKGDVGCVTAVEASRKLSDPAPFQIAARSKPGSTTGPIEGSTGMNWFVRLADKGSVGFDFDSAIEQLVQQYEQARQVLAQDSYQRLVTTADVRVVCPTGQWVGQMGQIFPCGEGAPDLGQIPVEPGS